ncbi:MAG: Hsp33 family molecular chaperone HslO [Betaproteobacteria bacterium]|nr:Hsp33 family molecular chaperone HslO [Betaproteobacteria bacterium]
MRRRCAPANERSREDFICGFLFPDLGIRGAFVRLGDSWRQMQEGRAYPPPVAELLGEMTAVSVLIGGNLKQPGRLGFQLNGQGPIRMLLIDCTRELNLRGMARFAPEALPEGASARQLLGLSGEGRLLLTLETPGLREPYRSMVPIEGETVAAVFEHYLEQSGQHPARLCLFANAQYAAGLFLQRLPGTAADSDGWDRVTQLASTVRAAELFSWSAETLLTRVFPEEDKQLFAPRPVRYHCPEDREKARDILRSLGRKEVMEILEKEGAVLIKDEIGNHSYHFDAEEALAVFPVLH